MMYQYSTLRKILLSCIFMSLITVILSGCGQNRKNDYVLQLPVQSGTHFLQSSINQIKSCIQEAAAENKNRNMPEIRVSEGSSIIKVIIHNEEEYQAFVDCLEEYMDYRTLSLDLAETDTVIYLDEILAYHNFEYLNIFYGGTISALDIENLNACPLREIELYHIYSIEENILSRIPVLQNIEIFLDSGYAGVLPTKELIHNTDCDNIAMICDDDKKFEVHFEELAEWDEINTTLLESNSYLKGLYVWNEDDYNYVSYEFCNHGEEIIPFETKGCEAFICIKDRESYGEKYFDILKVPVESIDYISWSGGGSRMMQDDINFDGYLDLIFTGLNRHSCELPRYCIGFLWNEKEQRYEWNATAPKHYRRIDYERKRIIDIYTSSLQDDYFIYEYHDGIFTEKKLEVIGSLTDYYLLKWQYYEDGKLMKILEENFDEETKLYYITYEENGIVTEEVLEKNDYKYIDYTELGKEYFPEFDFYWAG